MRKGIVYKLLWALLMVGALARNIAASDFAELADAAVRGEKGFMGAVLVATGDKVVFESAYGTANASHNAPNTVGTRFNIASLTKQFTGAAVMQLVGQGKLNLSDTVGKFLREAPDSWKTITIQQLLSHRSGLPGASGPADFPKGVQIAYTPDELLRVFFAKPLEFAPGTSWKYSNTGYYVLGRIIEKISGETYGDYIKRHIFQPASMRNSAYDVRPVQPRLAQGYTGNPQDLAPAEYVHMSLAFAAGALVSTIRDLFQWNRALASERILSKAAINKLFTPDDEPYHAGWFVEKDSTGKRRSFHEGSNPGYSAFILRYPDERAVVIVLSNLENAPVRALAERLSALLYQTRG